MLEAYKNIFINDKVISWQYLQRLNDIQNEAGLTLGNKLSNKHINYQNQKMKVCIAAQTLSNSVADSCLALKKIGQSEFKDCDATVTFIKIMDSLFDIMNSRNCKCRGSKSPIYSGNIEEEKDGSLTPLLNSRRKLCVLGLIVNITSFSELLPQLLKVQKFILTYKFSQDHLELFFNAVRGAESCLVQQDVQKLSPCVKNSVGYIAGWVAKRALMILNCPICKAAFISDKMPAKFTEYVLCVVV
ncbi:unnamed protein product, partial [Rotaria magnacalcarata]